MAISPDGRQVVAGTKGHVAFVWDVATQTQLLQLKGHNGRITSVSFSSDGTRILTSSWDATARLWETISGRELLTLKGPRDKEMLRFASMSADGLQITTVDNKQSIRVWRAATDQQIAAWKKEEELANQR